MKLLLVCSTILLWALCLFGVVDGRNSHQVAVGEWKVTLQGGWFFDASRIFPKTSSSSNINSKNDALQPRRRPWGSDLDCTLSLCQDGTFELIPLARKTKSTKKHNNRLPLRGQWKVLSNPYCVTDRFYDQLTLESYPRIEVSPDGEVPIRSVQLSMSGRLWGRYSNRRRRMNGRITHGALTCKEQGISKSTKRIFSIGRPIWASFSARRFSTRSTVEGWEDKRYFGY